MAADLRALDRPREAIRALDAADGLDPDEHAQVAIFTVAIAAHHDLGDPETAQKLIEEQRARFTDEKFELTAAAVEAQVARIGHKGYDPGVRVAVKPEAARRAIPSLGPSVRIAR